MKRWLIVLAAFFMTSRALSAGAEKIPFYSPYGFEPFIIDEVAHTGLIYDLERELNAQAQGQYEFVVVATPRSRLLKILQKEKLYVVPLVSPQWFGDTDMKKYEWTVPLMKDSNIILSPVKAPIENLNEDEIRGKKTVTVLGHRDTVLDPLIEKGIVQAEKSGSLRSSVLMVSSGRLDFIVSGRFLLNYLTHSLKVTDRLHFSTKSIADFDRRFMVAPGRRDLRDWLNGRVESMLRDPKWKEMVKAYELGNSYKL